MIKYTLLIGSTLFAANLVSAYVMSSYLLFNAIIVSIVIAVSTLLIAMLSIVKIADAFRYSLTLWFILICIIQLILALSSPCQREDNYYILGIMFLTAIEIISLLIVKLQTNINKL